MTGTKTNQSDLLNSVWTRLGAAVVGLVLSYAFASRAIDTGSYWHYLASLVFLVLSIKLAAQAVKKAIKR